MKPSSLLSYVTALLSLSSLRQMTLMSKTTQLFLAVLLLVPCARADELPSAGELRGDGF